MTQQYHILNGDALKERFPQSIAGERIVARECLVDGDVQGSDLTEFFNTRAQFINQHYQGYRQEDYFKRTVAEFQKMQTIPEGAAVHLWFEDDLFCQVNLWFVMYLLHQSNQHFEIFLIRPTKHTRYGFGGVTESELIALYKNKKRLTHLELWTQLWEQYQQDDTQQLMNTAQLLESTYPFVKIAVKAHIERIPTKESLGRVSETLQQIMTDLNTKEFGPVFKEFCKREPIYGFGDLQLKRIIDRLKT